MTHKKDPLIIEYETGPPFDALEELIQLFFHLRNEGKKIRIKNVFGAIDGSVAISENSMHQASGDFLTIPHDYLHNSAGEK